MQVTQTIRRAAAVLSLAASVWISTPAAHAAPRVDAVNLVPTITSLTLTNGQLLAGGIVTAVANGVTNVVPFSGVPVNLGLSGVTSSNGCQVLDLSLGPINLDVLGLVLETSRICLNLTALPGGGLLGDLLCSVGGLLNGGLNLNQILSGVGTGLLPGLTPTQVNNLLGGLQLLLNGVLGNLLDSVITGLDRGRGNSCGILHLELGPLDLNLLGLLVELDNCEGGPVVVDLSAERGRGNLLGNLLCSVLRGNGRLNLGDTLGDLLDLLTR